MKDTMQIRDNCILAGKILDLTEKERKLLTALAQGSLPEELTGSSLDELPAWVWVEDGRILLSPVLRDFVTENWPLLPGGAQLVMGEKRPSLANETFIETLGQDITGILGRTDCNVLIHISGKKGSGRSFCLQQALAGISKNCLVLDGERMQQELPVRLINELFLAASLYEAWMVVLHPQQLNPATWEALLGTIRSFAVITDGGEEERQAVNVKAIAGDYIVLNRPIPEVDRKRRLEILREMLGTEVLGDTSLVNRLLRPHEAFGSWVAFLKGIRLEKELGHTLEGLDISETEQIPSLSRLQANRSFEELCLPQNYAAQLREVFSMCKSRERVLYSWGFGDKFAYGNGISLLFYGAPGTGKTMAAQVLARELGKPLYRVELSSLISKYIGETQKNIGKIFDAARQMDCILLFDEADAIFAKRSDVADAQDRYSNAETAYLLQRIEGYDGIAVLTTNLLQNFDEAFRRRITCMVHFPMPDEEARRKLWQGIFPPQTPLESSVDMELLSEVFELSGASIRTIAMESALLAGEGGVGMQDILRAVRSEYAKMGRNFTGNQEEILRGWGV